MNSKLHIPEKMDGAEKAYNTYCRNCGTELHGGFCHECGQKASHADYTIKGFILEYLNNAYMWDTQIFGTIWHLMSKPGYLTRRFLDGKFVLYANPLKLNMFILFVFVTLFLLFHKNDDVHDSVHNFTREELVFGPLQVSFLVDNEEYLEKMNTSARDTVRLSAPLVISEDYPELITVVEVYENNQGKSADKWLAVLPRVLIDEKILVCDESGTYYFNPEAEVNSSDFQIVDEVGAKMVDIILNYFPLLILLSAPLLSFSIRLAQIRHKCPHLNHFIFALHYIAFLEMLVLIMYIAHLAVAPPKFVMEWIMIAGSSIYLVLAFKRVYGVNLWKSIVKSLYINIIFTSS